MTRKVKCDIYLLYVLFIKHQSLMVFKLYL